MKITTLLRHTLLATAATITAHAVPATLSTTTTGEGTVERGSFSAVASKAAISLRKDGRFTVAFVGKDEHRFSGTWRELDRDSVQLQLTDAFDREATGGGRIELKQMRDGSFAIGAISIAGTSSRGQKLVGRFLAGRAAPPPPPPPAAPHVMLERTRAGAGTLRLSGYQDTAVTHAYVMARSDGVAYVNVYGYYALGYVGTWTKAGPDTYELDVTGGIAGERIRGAVRLIPGARNFSRVELSGSSGRRYYSIEFDAR